MNLYVVRHGEVPSNLSEVIQNRYDEQLTEKGIEQSKKQEMNYQIQNLMLLYHHHHKRRLKQQDIQLKTKMLLQIQELQKEIQGNLLVKNGKIQIYKKTPEGAETLLSGINRTNDFLNDIRKKYKGKNVLVVTHNFVSKCIWINETNATNKDEINKFIHANDEIKLYFEKDENTTI